MNPIKSPDNPNKPHLVGGIPTPLNNMKVSWDDEIPNIWKYKTCSKPPTSHHFFGFRDMSDMTYEFSGGVKMF